MIHQLTLLPLHQKRPGRWAWLQKWHQTACHSWPWTRTEMLDFSIWGLEQAIHLFAWESWLQNWQFSSQLHCCPTTRSRARLNRSANLKPTSWTYSIHPLTVQRDFVHECYKQNLWKGQPYSPKLTGTYTTSTEKKKTWRKSSWINCTVAWWDADICATCTIDRNVPLFSLRWLQQLEQRRSHTTAPQKNPLETRFSSLVRFY